jgi:hypothetical protein
MTQMVQMTSIPSFRWFVPQAGFEWFLGRKKPRERLLKPTGRPATVGSTAPPGRTYCPLKEETGLFRTFAATAPTEEGIQAFANQFGALSGAWVTVLGADVPDLAVDLPNLGAGLPHLEGETGSGGDSYWHWWANIGLMKRAVRIWDMLRTGDMAELDRYFTRGEDNAKHVVRFNWPLKPEEKAAVKEISAAAFMPVTFEDVHRAMLGMLERSTATEEGGFRMPWPMHPLSPVTPALIFLARLVNEQLGKSVLSAPKMVLDGKHLRLTWLPRDLHGTLWLQLALSIAEAKEYRACKTCGKWFEVAPGVARTNRLFCSDACKFRAFREKQERAKALHAEGKPDHEIAKELGTDVATLRKWRRK